MSILNRRQMLARCSTGFGSVALTSLLNRRDPAPDFRPRAKNVIFLFMSGGLSHVDSFDHKPRLARDHDQPMPVKVERTQFNNNGRIMQSPWRFRRYGESGIEVSDLFPNLGRRVDDIAFIRSMTAPFSEHAQANFFMHTGFPFLGHPSAGAWAAYGLGAESRDLPAYVVLQSGNASIPHGGVGLFSNGFLPATSQASVVRSGADVPLRNVRSRQPRAAQRRRLDLIRGLDEEFLSRITERDPVETAIANYEMAFRMQAAVPELNDLGSEPEWLKDRYGLNSRDRGQAAYGRQCLLARRLVERGVRFVELSCLAYNIGGGNGANPWDQHGDIKNGHGKMGHQVDQPIATLLEDLKSRGLLDETLVVFAGEFGRTPFAQGSGRDHNPYGFTVWMAGGGIKGGTVYGATDELGYRAVDKPCDVYDMWGTVLYSLGLDHFDLTYRHGGRDYRLTDVHGDVLHDILA